MTSKKYRCKVELTTRPQADGKRLTFYPGDILEAKVLRKDQIEEFLDKKVIEEIRKKTQQTQTSFSDIKNEGADGS